MGMDKPRGNGEQPLPPSQFSFAFLNKFFWDKGVKNGTLEICGTEVTKSVVPYVSNSGKSRDHRITFSFVDENGQLRQMEKKSDYQENRRNDPSRDWGLPE